MSSPHRIEGYAIVSEDGMLANAAGIMPGSLIFEADQAFFERGLDGVDVVVHGRHSHESQRRSDFRRRLILTRHVSAIAVDSSNKKALFWNPAGASIEQAMTVLGVPGGSVGIIGGTEVFGLFLDRYDDFYLSRAPGVRLPGGRPVFPEVPARTPEEVLAQHGLVCGQRQVLDTKIGLAVVRWHRSSKTDQEDWRDRNVTKPTMSVLADNDGSRFDGCPSLSGRSRQGFTPPNALVLNDSAVRAFLLQDNQSQWSRQ